MAYKSLSANKFSTEDYQKVKEFKRLEQSIIIPDSFAAEFETQLLGVINTENITKKRKEEEKKKELMEKEFEKLHHKSTKIQTKLNEKVINEDEREIKTPKKMKKSARSSSVFSEVHIDPQHIAMKVSLLDKDLEQYERLRKGHEPERKITEIISKAHSPEHSVKLNSDDSSEDASVDNEYWKELWRNKNDANRRRIVDQNDPIALLNKLEGYSNEKLVNMTKSSKEELLIEIDKFLKQGLTPLEKFHDELSK